MNMMFNLFVNQRIFLALPTGEVAELQSALQQTATVSNNKASEDLYSHRLCSPAGGTLAIPLDGFGFVWLSCK